MSRLSLRLSRAISSSRRLKWRPASREEILARLLVKRAEAQQAGLDALETSLRQQIAWSLPMRRGAEAACEAADDEAVEDGAARSA
jgi:hypothetical protein